MQKGFSLLELIIALAIAGTTLLGLQILLQSQLRNSEYSWRYREAVDLAASALECRAYDGYSLLPSKNGYSLTETVADLYPRRSVTVSVRWAENNAVELHRDYYPGSL
ncbi:MAG: type II secretion system GspH family protein [Candidatus Margulisbacteria bacterium]|jgi:prepilin-type N-terminal cleavage/methylation domain-containing protein|nr:type II secretion system GspH family protein [Candidatus Margulisiibacteriota bacterium]